MLEKPVDSLAFSLSAQKHRPIVRADCNEVEGRNPDTARGFAQRDRPGRAPSVDEVELDGKPLALTDARALEGLIREAERYLAAVDLFRALGHEPRWRHEGGSRGKRIRACGVSSP